MNSTDSLTHSSISPDEISRLRMITCIPKVKWRSRSHVSDCNLWAVAHQASLSMGFSKQECWEWVAIYFFRRSSLPRGWTRVSCIEGRFFTIWATRETMYPTLTSKKFFFLFRITHIIFYLQLWKSRVNDPHIEGLASSSVSHSPLFKFLFSKCSTFKRETTFTWI